MTYERALLIDVGSTFTKVRAVDLGTGELIASAQAPTTLRTSVIEGLGEALARLGLGPSTDGWLPLATSSAAGGLRVLAIGHTPGLTAAAAQRAAHGAGGRVVAWRAGVVSAEDLNELCAVRPDVVVLAGGTDGGDERVLLANAERLAASAIDCAVIVAGNAAASPTAAFTLSAAGHHVVLVENILPALDRVVVDPCSAAIRELFIKRIVHTKGIGDIESMLARPILPTPYAVLEATRVLAAHDGHQLVCVDVGGSTTDVVSVVDAHVGDPLGVVTAGLSMSPVHRTVEGDLGLRASATTLVGAARAALPANVGAWLGDDAEARAGEFERHPERLLTSPSDREFEIALAGVATGVAIERHAGESHRVWTAGGEVEIRRGRDITGVSAMVATGGLFAHTAPVGLESWITTAAAASGGSERLVPRLASVRIDRSYIFFACGLLASEMPEVSIVLANRSLEALTGAGWRRR